MEEGTIIEWLVEEGTRVAVEDPIVLVDTDKVAYEVEAPQSGLVLRIVAQPGDTIPVGGALCELEVEEQ